MEELMGHAEDVWKEVGHMAVELRRAGIKIWRKLDTSVEHLLCSRHWDCSYEENHVME